MIVVLLISVLIFTFLATCLLVILIARDNTYDELGVLRGKEAAEFLKNMREKPLTDKETEIIKKNVKAFDRLA